MHFLQICLKICFNIFSMNCFWFLQIERTFSLISSPLTVCLGVSVGDIAKDAASFNWMFLFCFFWYFKEVVESTSLARGVGFEPTSSFEHGISNPTPYQARRPPL